LHVKAAQVHAGRQQLPPGLAPLVLAFAVALGTATIDQQPMDTWWTDTGRAAQTLETPATPRFSNWCGCLVPRSPAWPKRATLHNKGRPAP